MLTRHIRGTTAELNALNLPAGHVAYDVERKAIRFYDGETQGGFEAIGEAVYNLGPGPQELQAGTFQAGYFGEVSAEELISGDALAAEVGLSSGVGMNSDAGWLKFASKGKILYVAKRPLRHSVSWDQLYQLGLVYGTRDVGLYPTGNPTYQTIPVEAVGEFFKVRLLTGGEADPASEAGGEWDDLMVPMGDGTFASLSDSELGVTSGNGRSSWVQETSASDAGRRINRGSSSLSRFNTYTSSTANALPGWRPVLELTSATELLFPLQDFHFKSEYVQKPVVYEQFWTDVGTS